jgi:hypothetical protein
MRMLGAALLASSAPAEIPIMGIPERLAYASALQRSGKGPL